MQRTLVVRALADVNHLVVWWHEVLLAQAADSARALVAILTDLQLLLGRFLALWRQCLLLDLRCGHMLVVRQISLHFRQLVVLV